MMARRFHNIPLYISQAGNLPPPYANASGAGGYQPNSTAAAQALEMQTQELKKFWREQQAEIEQVGTDPAEFKNHQLPLARIKKVVHAHGLACAMQLE